jgi:hypothetical protein
MARNLSVASVNEGRTSGLADQHSSISLRQSGSQFSGIGGRRVLFTMPPSHNKECLVSWEDGSENYAFYFFLIIRQLIERVTNKR